MVHSYGKIHKYHDMWQFSTIFPQKVDILFSFFDLLLQLLVGFGDLTDLVSVLFDCAL